MFDADTGTGLFESLFDYIETFVYLCIFTVLFFGGCWPVTLGLTGLLALFFWTDWPALWALVTSTWMVIVSFPLANLCCGAYLLIRLDEVDGDRDRIHNLSPVMAASMLALAVSLAWVILRLERSATVGTLIFYLSIIWIGLGTALSTEWIKTGFNGL